MGDDDVVDRRVSTTEAREAESDNHCCCAVAVGVEKTGRDTVLSGELPEGN